MDVATSQQPGDGRQLVKVSTCERGDDADALGGDMQTRLSQGLPGGNGGAEHIAGAMLLASDGGAISALQAVLKS